MEKSVNEKSMKPSTHISWKEAFWSGPGPRSAPEAIRLALKGVCMGTADIIPGVSGGTIALITGIYENLLEAIKSANILMIQRVLNADFKNALAGLHLRFLLALFSGIGLAIISLARLMNYLLHHHPVEIWSLFFGLIAASIIVVGKHVEKIAGVAGLSLAGGMLIAHIIVNIIPIATPEALWFIFLSGFIAICAMILPGLSGAFILLILGKYEFITATLKNPFVLDNLAVIFVFCMGCLAGLTSFTRLLNYLLSKWHNLTLAFLTGLMIGSMQKIWPWKEILDTVIIRGKEHVVASRNILPQTFDGQLLLAVVLIVIGFVAVILLERLSERTQ
ncbi:DUF368 domain-containing protein [Desulfococcaceae bacterium HSG9]|nr:DUF368 domain-containing protein [Desulfococcaceae bacterium HSG9]